MKKTVKLLSMLLVFVMVIGTATVFAESGDVYDKDGNIVYTMDQLALSEEAQEKVMMRPSQYVFNIDGEFYSMDDAIKAFTADEDNFEEHLKENYTPVEVLKVINISFVEAEKKIIVTFDKEAKEVPEGLKVFQNEEELALEDTAFAVVEGKVEITVPEVEPTFVDQTIEYAVQLGSADKVVATDKLNVPAKEAVIKSIVGTTEEKIQVPFGTEVEALRARLKTEVDVEIVGEENPEKIAVNWDLSKYDGKAPGVYTFIGELAANEKTNPNGLKVTIEVTVAYEEVETIEAKTTMVNKKDDTLTFSINGQEELKDPAKLVEAGYTVEFLASAPVFTDSKATSTTGKLAELNIDSFEYEVVVKKGEKEVARSIRQKVTVKDYASTVTSISEIKLSANNLEIKSGRLAKDDTNVKVQVMGRTLASPNEDTDITKQVDLTSDRIALLTVDNEGTITLSKENLKGDVKITAKASDEIQSEIIVNVGNDTRAIAAETTTIIPETLELSIGQSHVIKVQPKDQYGDIIVVSAKGIQTEALTVDGKELAPAVSVSTVDAKTHEVTLTLEAGKVAGNGEVVVKCGETKLGTIALNVKKPGEIVEYKLENNEGNYTIDLKTNVKTLDLYLNGYDAEGLLNSADSLEKDETKHIVYEVKSSNEEIATAKIESGKILVTGKAIGNANITVYKKVGALTEIEKTAPIEVKNSTPRMDKITVAEEIAKVTTAGAYDLNKIITITTVDPEGNNATAKIGTDDKITVGEGKDAIVVGKVIVNFATEESTLSYSKGAITGTGKDTMIVTVVDNEGNYKDEARVEVEIAEVEAPKSKDASVSKVTVKDVEATPDEGNVYNVVLEKGTELSKLTANDIDVTPTDTKANVAEATTSDNGETWTVVVTAEDGTTKVTYTINVTVAE